MQLATHLIILLLPSLFPPLLSASPVCLDPPPPLATIPNLTACYTLIRTLFATSEFEHNEPLLWSRNPPASAGAESRQLPYHFTTDQLAITNSNDNVNVSSLSTNNTNDKDNDKNNNDINDCEFIIDTLPGKDEEEDTFPTLLVAQRARRIVRKCMVGGVGGMESLGAEPVGPKRAVVVVLVKRVPGALGGMNRTGLGMLEMALNGSSGLGDDYLESY